IAAGLPYRHEPLVLGWQPREDWMKAIVYDRYGPPEVLRLEEVQLPGAGPGEVRVRVRAAPVTTADWRLRAPAFPGALWPPAGPGEVRVRVRAASVTTADWRLRASAFPGVLWLPGRLMTGLFRPRNRVLGLDFAGEVDAVGDGVSRFATGDRVFGFAGKGAHAEYLVMPEAGAIAATPEDLSDPEAAALPFGALSALVFLRDYAGLLPGQSVAVVGASGGVGAYAVQVARALGARVTGIASAGSRGFVLGLGAERFVDYGVEDFTFGAERYDLVLDTVGATDFSRAR